MPHATLTRARDGLRAWYARESETVNYDLFFRFPALLYFAMLAWLQLRAIRNVWTHEHLEGLTAACSLAARGAALIAVLTFALLTLARSRPVARAQGIMPRIVAVAGAGFLFAMVLLERGEPSPAWDAASAVLITVGNLLVAVVVLELGRSFSTMAEARRLVVTGPYRAVRHPLYLAEEIAILGMLLQYRSTAAVAMLVVQFGLQLWRMHYEEQVLSAAFPEYRDYAQRTARILPGVY